MSTRKFIWLIVATAIGATSACNYTVGECWRRGEGDEGSAGVGAGFAESSAVGAGSGDFGDTPPGGSKGDPLQCNKTEDSPEESAKSPQDPCAEFSDVAGFGATSYTCSDECSSKCPPPGIGPFATFDLSDFPFVTTTNDDGVGKGGGWQVANAKLEFMKVIVGESVIVRKWHCNLTIGMPLRTEEMGRVDSYRAASISKETAEFAAEDRDLDYNFPQGVFCIYFVKKVEAAFGSKYPRLGAKVK
jgi:hypothetical protein